MISDALDSGVPKAPERQNIHNEPFTTTLPPARCLPHHLPTETFELRVQTEDALNEAGKLWPVTYLVAELFVRLFPDELATVSVLELGAGTGALAIGIERYLSLSGLKESTVISTDLPDVLPLIRRNIELNSSPVTAMPLPWGSQEALSPILGKITAGKDGFDAVLACECLYWGGWNLLAEDTRPLLQRTLRDSRGEKILIGFTIRDRGREIGFVEGLLEEWRIDCVLHSSGQKVGDLEWFEGENGERRAREWVEKRVEGDVLVFCLVPRTAGRESLSY